METTLLPSTALLEVKIAGIAAYLAIAAILILVTGCGSP